MQTTYHQNLFGMKLTFLSLHVKWDLDCLVLPPSLFLPSSVLEIKPKFLHMLGRKA